MMRILLTALLIVTSISGCATRPALPSETYANPVDALAGEYAVLVVELEMPQPSDDPSAITPEETTKQSAAATVSPKNERQLLAKLRSLIAQTRMAQSVLADPTMKAQASALLKQMQATEAALFKKLFVNPV
jgi:hypothetical protein